MADEEAVDVFDPGNFIEQERRNARVVALQGLDADPEKAARALELSRATGAGPNTVYDNLENFEAQTKSALASNLLRDNEYLRQFVNTYPLAAKIANDDYGNLDKVSQGTTSLYGPLPHFPSLGILGRAIQGAYHGVQEGFEGGIGQFSWVKNENERAYLRGTLGPLSATPILAPVTATEAVLKSLSAAIKGIAEGAKEGGEELYGQMTGDPTGAKLFGRSLAGLVEWATTAPPHMRPHIPQNVVDQARTTLTKAQPWLDQGLEPPLGIDPIIDQIKIKQSEIDLDGLAELEKDTQKSALKERSPQAFAEFMRQHTSAQIGITPEVVRKLYGDEVPLADDGKLGFIPRLKDQLTLAELSGTDILVPVADWLAYVDPAIAKELRDDIRVRPGGVTKNEAVRVKEQAAELEPTLPEGLTANIEPQRAHLMDEQQQYRRLSIVDTEGKVALEATLRPFGPDAYQMHSITNESKWKSEGGGMPRYSNLGEFAYVEAAKYAESQGKKLYAGVSGETSDKARAVHQRLIDKGYAQRRNENFDTRDKIEIFSTPKADAIRSVREQAGLNSKLSAEFWEIDTATDEWQRLTREHIGSGYELIYKPAEEYKGSEKLVVERVKAIAARMAPKLEDVRVVQRIEKDGKEIHGLYLTDDLANKLIAVSLNSQDAGRTIRHEIVHYLKDGGFFTAAEWDALDQAAREGQWMGKYDVRERYKRYETDEAALIEEAVADEIGTWGSATEPARGRYNKAVEAAFQKLANFFKQILDAIKETFGHAPQIDKLFEKVESGVVGRRRQGKAGTAGAKTAEGPKQGELDVTRMEDKDPFQRAAGIGMTEPQLSRYMKLIEKQREEDLAAQTKKLVEEEKRKQTQTWKENERKEREEVVADFNARPDVQVDEYFRTGRIYGEEGPKPKLGQEYLSKDEKARLPKSYVAEKGMDPDDVAPLFGYSSGAEMIEHLSAYTEARGQSGMQPMAFNRRLVNAEVERRMEQKYGDLNENILEAVKDQVLSETQLDMLHEETVFYAEQAGAQIPLPKNVIKDGVIEQVNLSRLSDINSDKYLTAAGKAAREAEMNLLKGDYTEALKFKQQQYMAVIAAKEARAVEKEVAQFDRKAKGYRGREVPKAVDPEFGTYVQAILSEAGYRVGQSAEEIARGVEFYGYGTLDNFVLDKSSYGFELPVPEGYTVKPIEEQSVGEFRTMKDVVDALDKAGRDSKKIIVGGERMDREVFEQKVIETLEQRPVRALREGHNVSRWNFFYGLDAPLTRVEELAKALDFRQEMGPFFEALIVPYEQSKSKAFDMLSDLSKELRAIKGFGKEWQRSLGEELPGDFVWDTYNDAPMKLTRWNMIKMMLNMGTEQNFAKLAYGIAAATGEGRPPPHVVAWARHNIERFVHTHATPEDWQFTQKVFDLFDGWRKEADTLYRNLSGVAPKWINARQIDTPHGSFAGGYFPLIPDRNRPLPGHRLIKEGGEAEPKGPLGGNYFKATTHTPFYKERTGANYFVDISGGVENIAGRMQQVIHDIAYRDFVINAGKVIYNPKIMNAIRKHYGPEYAAQLDPWLKRVANEYTANETELGKINDTLKRFRFNLIASALPLNYAVMFSPSMGLANPKAFLAYYSNRAENAKMVQEHSKEIKHLIYNLDRDVAERFKELVDNSGWSGFQKRAVEGMFWPLMQLEQQTRSITFYDEFMKQKEKGLTDGEAANVADSKVREQHGSMAVGDLPALMASKNEFVRMSTLFMGYFTTQRNWLRQAPDQARQGDFSGLAATLWGTLGVAAIFNAALFEKRKEKDTLFSYLGRSVISTPMSMVPFLREGYSYLTEGHHPKSPIFGLMTATYKIIKDGYDFTQGKKVKKPIRDVASFAGAGLGVPGALQIGRTAGFAYDVARKEQRPRDIVEWMRGIFTGEARLKK